MLFKANQLNAKKREKNELMVEENILKLELRKLRGFLNARADEVSFGNNRYLTWKRNNFILILH